MRLALSGAQVLFTSREDGDARKELPDIGVRVVVPRQVHGATIVDAGAAAGDADGLVTTNAGVAPAVLVADCLPVVVAGAGGVAVLHAGWRGLAAGILPLGVSALRERGVTGPLEAAIGPAAGPCCYEVGEELRERFPDAVRGANLDLKAIAEAQLRSSGVAAVHDVAVCTICDERYFSYRREGDAAGRQAGIAWLT